MSEIKTVNIPASGKCPHCGITNTAQIPTRGPVGTPSRCVVKGSCGKCQARVTLTGNTIIK